MFILYSKLSYMIYNFYFSNVKVINFKEYSLFYKTFSINNQINTM